ncbi:MAG: hypothetical protein RR851_13010 [Clostridium sp.]
MSVAMTKSEFMTRYINDYYNSRLKKEQGERYEADRNREYARLGAMHRKRSGR